MGEESQIAYFRVVAIHELPLQRTPVDDEFIEIFMSWKLLPWIQASMSFHMALDEVLFREREEAENTPPILRFYFADQPSVTIGYSRPLPLPVGEGRGEGLPVVRRLTGGGRVEHGQDLIFSLIAHKRDDESFHSVRVSYWKIHEALKKGFETLGLKPRFYRCDEDLPEGPECFRYPISSDLALGKHKIAGGSQKRSAGALLHQESVVVPAGLDGFKLAEAFRAGFEAVFNTRLEAEPLQPVWFEKAKVLAEKKYQVLL